MAKAERIILGMRSDRPFFLERCGTDIALVNGSLDSIDLDTRRCAGLAVWSLDAFTDIAQQSVLPMSPSEYSVYAGLSDSQLVKLANLYKGTVCIDSINDIRVNAHSFGLTKKDYEYLQKLADRIADQVWSKAKNILAASNLDTARKAAESHKSRCLVEQRSNVRELESQLERERALLRQMEASEPLPEKQGKLPR